MVKRRPIRWFYCLIVNAWRVVNLIYLEIVRDLKGGESGKRELSYEKVIKESQIWLGVFWLIEFPSTKKRSENQVNSKPIGLAIDISLQAKDKPP